MKKIFITGGLGYIGSILVRDLLNQGYYVVVYDNCMVGGEHFLDLFYNLNFSFIYGDTRDFAKLSEILDNSYYAVVNLSAFVSHQLCENFRKNAIEVNQEAPIELFKIANTKSIPRFIFISTCSNYGKTTGDHLAKEDESLFPLSLYAETKVNAEKTILEISKGMETSVTILRFGTIFGLSPRMRFDLLINEIVLNAYLREKISIYSPKAWRPYLHILDASRSIIKVLEADSNKISGEVFNVLSFNLNKELLIQEIQKYIDVDFEVVDTGSDNRDYKVSNKKISDTLGFVPLHSLNEGIQTILSALENNLITNPKDINFTNLHSRWKDLDFQ